ncbi:MAG: chorismate synthase [Elusimicrobiota bacterium]
MKILRLLTAGESHGPALTGILEGLPAGLELTTGYINAQLARRQKGHGRGGRMKIETDQVELLGGVRHGRTLGSPVAMLIRNRDWKNWQDVMAVEGGGDETRKTVRVPRPGHADYVGGVKYGHADLRNVLERASARETAIRTALAAAARRLLEEFDIHLGSRVTAIGAAADENDAGIVPAAELNVRTDASPVRCLDDAASARMVAEIDAAKKDGDTLGGVFEVRVSGLPVGLGSHVHWDRRLEGDLARAFMSLNGIKGVEIGLGFGAAALRGSQVHDALGWDETKTRAARETNRSGGIDGGITTGDELVIRAAMKPISTLLKPIGSIDLDRKEDAAAHIERSDFCAVPAAAVIGEALAALELADAFLRKFGGDSIEEIRAHIDATPRG